MVRNQAWFDRMYAEHSARVLAYFLRRTQPTDADDATAEVFATAWRRRSDVPGGDRTLPWLYGVARNVLSHQRRSHSRFRRLAGRVASIRDIPPPSPEVQVVERWEHAQVRHAVSQLKPTDQEVLLLAAWEGLSHRDIGQILGCSQAAVDKRLSRAKQRLAKQYETETRQKADRPPASAMEGGGGG